MTLKDLPAVTAIERETFSEPWSERGFRYALELPENLFLAAERSDGRIVGYCGLYASGEEGEITNVAVAETDRRQGIADAMLDELFTLAVRQGVRLFYLEVRVSNGTAIRLYQRHGFSPCGVRPDFYRWPTEDAYIMRCETGRTE